LGTQFPLGKPRLEIQHDTDLRSTGLWGLSPTEVFVAFNDSGYEQYACGGDFMIWFDGSQFHQF
jgi:hypothetical protein